MPFAKGQSGNASGRKIEAIVKRAARSESERSLAILAVVRDDPAAPAAIRAQAAMQILALAKWNNQPQIMTARN
jgi:hypothetical protein